MPDLAPAARQQLAAWETLARDWPVVSDLTTVSRCGDCGQGVMLLSDRAGKPYCYTPDQVLALTVNHLRSCHPDLDPDKSL